MDDLDGVHVVVGAGGGTGTALVRLLAAGGRRVRAVNRSGRTAVPEGVETVAGDATDADRMREVCRGATVVYNSVNPPLARWRSDFPAALDGVLAGAEAAGARMVFVDDTWMYGRVTGPMTEDTPHRPVSGKGVLRAWLAERVLAAHANGRVRTVIGRAPELYGPGVESLLGRNVFRPALYDGSVPGAGRAVWFGELDLPLGPMYVEDFARGLITLAEAEAALGRAWHLPTPPATTARAFLDLVYAEVGRPTRLLQGTETHVRALGVGWRTGREVAELLYQFRQPHVVDASAYRSAFGEGRVTPYEEGVRRTLDWYRDRRGGSS